MQTLKFRSASGRRYKANLPAPLEGFASSFLFSYHKSGSTLMDNMVSHYCTLHGVPTFSLFSAAFNCGVPTREVTADSSVCFSKHGRVYLGFRHYPSFDLDLTGLRSILLVRDPRDMLVSLYYSVTKSHYIPRNHLKFRKKRIEAVKMDIEQFARQQSKLYMGSLRQYQKKLPRETLTIYRYEDVIYEKIAWLRDLVEQLGLPVDSATIIETAKKFDIFPRQEDRNKHIRQVHPGNHKSQLSQETIEILNHDLKEFLQQYNYV